MPKVRDHPMAPTAANPRPNSQIDIEDWDSLFGAVEERLRSTVEKLDTTTTPLPGKDNVSRIKSVVLDCVSALETLHQSLKQERRAHSLLEVSGANSDTSAASPLTGKHCSVPNN
jgi:hypothetical protein